MENNCHVEVIKRKPSEDELLKIEVCELLVWGMGCPNCAIRVHNSILSIQGVVEVCVDHEVGMAQVSYNPTLVTADDLIDAVARSGGDGRHEYRAKLLIRNKIEMTN